MQATRDRTNRPAGPPTPMPIARLSPSTKPPNSGKLPTIKQPTENSKGTAAQEIKTKAAAEGLAAIAVMPKLDAFLFPSPEQKLLNKYTTLNRMINNLIRENDDLKAKNKSLKRTGIVLGIHKEMERQDTAIEIIRELYTVPQEQVDTVLINALEEGPKRIRPPTREELYIQLRQKEKIFADWEDKTYKLNPGRDKDKYHEAGVQTDNALELSSDSVYNLDILKDERAADTKLANKRLADLSRAVRLQEDTILKIKDLIESKGSHGQKLTALKEDYEDLKADVEFKGQSLEEMKAKNEKINEKLSLLAEAREGTVESLRAHLATLEGKKAQIQGENKNIDTVIEEMQAKILQVAQDNQLLDLYEQISQCKGDIEKQDRNLQGIDVRRKGVEQEIQGVEKMIEKVVSSIQSVEDDMALDRYQVEDELEEHNLQRNDIQWKIRELKSRVVSARGREISLLEEVEALEKEYAERRAKSAALTFLGRENKDFLTRDSLWHRFREQHEAGLNNKILENTQARDAVRELEDLLYILKDTGQKVNKSRYDSMDNSLMESIRTFDVVQPEEILGDWKRKDNNKKR